MVFGNVILYYVSQSHVEDITDIAMSIYASSSEQYWNSRKKIQPLDKRKVISFVCLLFLICCLCFTRKTSDKNGRILLKHQPSVSKDNIKKCNKYFKTNQNQCLSICQEERNQRPRPSIHQACLHGCNTAFSEATEKGCQDLDEIDALNEVNGLSYKQCIKFMNMIPKPEIFTVCRKYHQIAAEKGFIVSKEYIKDIVGKEE